MYKCKSWTVKKDIVSITHSQSPKGCGQTYVNTVISKAEIETHISDFDLLFFLVHETAYIHTTEFSSFFLFIFVCLLICFWFVQVLTLISYKSIFPYLELLTVFIIVPKIQFMLFLIIFSQMQHKINSQSLVDLIKSSN